MKLWITKYALTSGIFSVDIPDEDVKDGMVVVRGDYTKGTYTQYFHGEGRDWHRTEIEAVERAILMGNKRTNSLKKSLSKNQSTVHRFVAELQMLREGRVRPVKYTKAQLAQLKKESQEQQLADEQAEYDRMQG